MAFKPTEILSRIGDKEYLEDLISDARKPPSNADANQILIATMIYLAENLRRSGEASERHAEGLKTATWWLVRATAALAFVALVQLCFALWSR